MTFCQNDSLSFFFLDPVLIMFMQSPKSSGGGFSGGMMTLPSSLPVTMLGLRPCPTPAFCCCSCCWWPIQFVFNRLFSNGFNVQGDPSPQVLGSVALTLGSSPAYGPLVQLATAQGGQGELSKLIGTESRTQGDGSPCIVRHTVT